MKYQWAKIIIIIIIIHKFLYRHKVVTSKAVAGLTSFYDSMSKRVLNLLETVS